MCYATQPVCTRVRLLSYVGKIALLKEDHTPISFAIYKHATPYRSETNTSSEFGHDYYLHALIAPSSSA